MTRESTQTWGEERYREPARCEGSQAPQYPSCQPLPNSITTIPSLPKCLILRRLLAGDLAEVTGLDALALRTKPEEPGLSLLVILSEDLPHRKSFTRRGTERNYKLCPLPSLLLCTLGKEARPSSDSQAAGLQRWWTHPAPPTLLSAPAEVAARETDFRHLERPGQELLFPRTEKVRGLSIPNRVPAAQQVQGLDTMAGEKCTQFGGQS
ncbi:uncharacterized protein LOC118153996 isoform X2 [Callithrix jacchus]